MDPGALESAEHLIDLALAEDLGAHGDITSLGFVPKDHRSRGVIVAREPSVVAGVAVAARVFEKIDAGSLTITVEKPDGSAVERQDSVLTVEGSTRSILSGERVALNFLQRLSGIATLTREFVRRVNSTGAKAEILDTRKTTPGWRLLEKAAVKAGGGRNHRMGLHDAAMVKDNHLVAEHRLSAVNEGIRFVREQFPDAFIELEADRLDQVREFLGLEGVDVILLDNMSPDRMREAVALRDREAPQIKLEASGGVSIDTVAGIAQTGVDFISVGALTHSARAADFSLELQPDE